MNAIGRRADRQAALIGQTWRRWRQVAQVTPTGGVGAKWRGGGNRSRPATLGWLRPSRIIVTPPQEGVLSRFGSIRRVVKPRPALLALAISAAALPVSGPALAQSETIDQ